jgi:hypothetical protein
MSHFLTVLPERFAICRLMQDQPVPEWAPRGNFFTITRTGEELSIVCEERLLPEDVGDMRVEGGWRAFQLMGPIPFEQTGVIAGLTRPLADAGISVSVIATFDTDYLFVKNDRLQEAIKALSLSGARVGVAVEVGKRN